jgi:acetyltransferase-like isoleucine patch superfamily enzyme
LTRTLRGLAASDPAGRLWYAQWARSRLFSRWVARSFAAFGEGAQVWPPIALWGAGNIALGDGVKIGSGSRISTDGDGRLEVGAGTRMMGETMIHAIESIVIGRQVLISRGVTIVDYQFNFADPETPIMAQGKRSSPVRIGDGTWIGAGAVIVAGVTIGRNAVVGANAVVTRDVGEHQVVAGAPARPLERSR